MEKEFLFFSKLSTFFHNFSIFLLYLKHISIFLFFLKLSRFFYVPLLPSIFQFFLIFQQYSLLLSIFLCLSFSNFLHLLLLISSVHPYFTAFLFLLFWIVFLFPQICPLFFSVQSHWNLSLLIERFFHGNVNGVFLKLSKFYKFIPGNWNTVAKVSARITRTMQPHWSRKSSILFAIPEYKVLYSMSHLFI